MLPATPKNEDARLAALQSMKILDTPMDQEFDDLVRLAAAICGTPMSLVSLVDADRQWFKALVGLSVRETPREVSFCAHAIQQTELFVVPDATQDVRFAENPLVLRDPSIRFYAGMPLEAPSGHAIGTLCVMDTVPRMLTKVQTDALKVLAAQVRGRMALSAQQRALQAAVEERDRMSREIHEKEALFRLFMDNGPFCSYIKDSQGRFKFYNKQVEKRFGISEDAWLGKTNAEVIAPEVARTLREHDFTVMERGEPVEFLEETPAEDGTTVQWKSIKFPYRDSNGEMLLAGISLDVTAEMRQRAELERANAMLSALSTTDSLTGVKNRRAFDERLEIEFTLAKRKKRDLSLMMIDIDDFKLRNDVYGHAAGDRVLRELGRILRTTVRSTDFVARYGGEEFVVLLPETDTRRAMSFGKRLQARINAGSWEGGKVTVSVGVAMMTEDVMATEQMLRMADKALYAAKHAGKDRIRVHEEMAYNEVLLDGLADEETTLM